MVIDTDGVIIEAADINDAMKFLAEQRHDAKQQAKEWEHRVDVLDTVILKNQAEKKLTYGETVIAIRGGTYTKTDPAKFAEEVYAKPIELEDLFAIIAAASPAAVCTATCKTAGIRGNQHIVFHDTSGLGAGGFTVTLAGGTAVTGGGVPLTGGSGTEDVSNLLTTLTPGLYELIGASTNDTTNLGRWKTYLNAKAAATEGRLESLVFATNGSLVSTATAISTSTTNCNFTRFNHLWMPNSEGHPSRIAAVFAADRSVTEQSNPSPRYMNEPLPGIPVYSQLADVPTTSIADTALNNGVTPIGLRNGAATVIRGITTYCLNGSQPDDRALDISNQSMSDYAYKSFAQIWNDDISVNFLYVIDEPDLESGAEVSGLAIYPSLWNNILIEQLRLWEKRGWVYDVSNHLPETIYDSSTKRLLFNCPVYATPGLYQIGGNIRQVAS
jgi:phage tail sheath gpL-like